ncbi:MAG: hypothetical protein SFV15_20890 [Polyangiaceae bacterium]|nr:hypothetical protein [Polyangiaceae bacterium]
MTATHLFSGLNSRRGRVLRSTIIACATLGGAQALAAPSASGTKATPTAPATPVPAQQTQPQLSPDAQRTLSTPPAFTSLAEVRKIANARLASLQKTAAPASAPALALTISLETQAPGSSLELFRPERVKLSPYKSVSFKSTVEASFRPERPRVEVTLSVEPSRLYVLDCPITGVGGGHHRLEFAATGSRFSTVETRANSARLGRFMVTYLAERAGELRLTLQGHIVDGEEYTWGFGGCRVTPVPYGAVP